jgi:hypothetical protein
VLAPEAVSVAEVPAQIAISAPALISGNGLTVTVKVVVPEQPTPEVPVIVYVVVEVGFAVTVPPVVAERPVAGLQVKAFAPEAVRLVLPPMQMALLPAIVTDGVPFTATITLEESIHPAALVPVTL